MSTQTNSIGAVTYTEAHSSPFARFFRFMSSSLTCTGVDQVIAWTLFSTLRESMPQADFLRILIASIIARFVSLTLNFLINNRLVFSCGSTDTTRQTAHTFGRFLIVALTILSLSSLGVWWAHTSLGAPEWQAKIVVDICLFFVNYNAQRIWVFKGEQQASDLG